jgi:hypothetical protein
MIKSFLTILFCTSIISPNETIDTQPWEEVIEAIIKIESNGNLKAVSPSGKHVGPMQIAKIVVDDCNEYLRMLKKDKRYTYEDRWDLQKSKEMFVLIQMRYNKTNDVEKAARIWNGGCGYSKKATDGYYMKFLRHYKKRSK